MKNVLKIAIVPCCLASLYHGDISASEKLDASSKTYISQHKLHLQENYKNETSFSNTLEFDRTPKVSAHNTSRLQRELKTNDHSMTQHAHRPTNSLGWYDNNRINVKYTEAKQIGLYENGGLYIYMDPSFTSPQWTNAFEKGLADRAKGQNGIKILNNIIELKINANARLYTTKLHKNDQGDYIAILDNKAGHKEIKKINNKRKLEIKNCDSVSSKMNRYQQRG